MMARKPICCAAVLVACAGAAAQEPLRIPRRAEPLAIDGKVDDAFWRDLPPYALAPAEPGVPAGMGGQLRLAARGGYLCLEARLPEPGGRVLARSIGRNPVWERDSPGSPPVEDRLSVVLTGGGEGNRHELALEVNPWGAYRLERNGKPANSGVLAAALAGPDGWQVEAAIPLDLVGQAPVVRVERIRSRRPLAPEFRWSWPSGAEQARLELPAADSQDAGRPVFAPPLIGNTEAELEVGRVGTIPPLIAEWDHPSWKDVPVFELPDNETGTVAPRHRTEVRWVQDGTTLALLIRASEPEPVVARAGGRDSAVAADDHLALHLATSGSAFVEVAINSVGAIADALDTGPHIERPQPAWNLAGLQVLTNIRYSAWTARINVPLQECAAALGETGVPRNWRVVVSRHRAARPGEAAETAALPPIGTNYFYGPVRYRRMVLAEVGRTPAGNSRAGDLDDRVWSASYRRFHAVRSMVASNQRRRVDEAVLREREQWEKIATKDDWERYRDTRLKLLRESIGVFPPARPPLNARVTATHGGNGYRLENLVYQTRPGFYAAANLYLPATAAARVPVIVIQHSQHYPRIQGELHDMGELWARKGAAVLLLERLGYGERAETTPLYRQGYASRFTFKKQLNLIGESHTAWMAWDIIRAVDLLYERPEIDRDRIVLIGAVAGGGEPAALAAVLDPRISAVIPYNYDQGHVRLDADYFGEIANGLSPWFITASLAPRRYVRAFEFGWEGAEEPDYPELWVSGWERSQKIWGLYGAERNLAAIQAFGLIRLSVERIQHCFNIGPAQRKEMYPLLERWFQVPSAAAEDAGILPDSELTYNEVREAARKQEAGRRRPQADLLCIPPKVAAELDRRPLHAIARDIAVRDLEAARRKRASMDAGARQRDLRDALRGSLGAIDPEPSWSSRTVWSRTRGSAVIEAAELHVESGIDVPLLFIRPAEGSGRRPVVVAVAQGGKRDFLLNRAGEIERLLQSGTAVCLPDVRGTGETSPDPQRGDESAHTDLAETEAALGSSLVGARLKDVLTVVAYVRGRPDVDAGRVAVWGDSFAPVNPPELVLDELQYEAGPVIQRQAEPAGALLAMLAGLYDERIRAVAANGGLASFASVLDNAFTYVPMDSMIPGLLKQADIPDIAAALAPRPLLVTNAVDGRNRALSPETPARSVVEWLVTALNKPAA